MSLYKIVPDVILEIRFGNSPSIANDDTDFPEPDSPTIPKISFSSRWYEMLCITSFLLNAIDKLEIDKIEDI